MLTVNTIGIDQRDVELAYVMGAEPRENKIKALGECCLQLQKDKDNLIDKVRELEAQIEKMRSTLIDIRANTDDVNIEWQIKHLFDELEIK